MTERPSMPEGWAQWFNPPTSHGPVAIANAPEVIAGWVEAWTRALPPAPPWPEHLVPSAPPPPVFTLPRRRPPK